MSVNHKQLVLWEFGNEQGRILLDLGTSTWKRSHAEHVGRTQCGIGQQKRLGVFRSRRTFVAIFQRDGELLFCADSRLVSLSSKSVSTVFRIHYPVRLFELREGGMTIWSARYLSFEWEEWDDWDILRHVHRVASSENEKRRFIVLWAALERGVDVRDKELQAQLAQFDEPSSK